MNWLFNWLFLDMDSYFAPAEQHLRPELRNKTVGIVPVLADGTCIIAAGNDAKKLGVKVGLPVREARRLCPHITLVEARPQRYVDVHQELIRSIDKCVPIHKVYSIDEWAIRLQGDERQTEHALDLARRIKRQLFIDFSPWLTCSIGIAPTRLLAKIASDVQKPNGLVVLSPDDLPGRLEGLKLNDFAGIGKSMLRRLNGANVHTSVSFGSSRAKNPAESGAHCKAKRGGSASTATTCPNRRRSGAPSITPTCWAPSIATTPARMASCCDCSATAPVGFAIDYVAHRLHVRVRSYNGGEWNADIALDGVQSTQSIVQQFETIWRTRPWPLHAAVRPIWRTFSQVSITLAGLAPRRAVTPSLFADLSPDRLSQTIDRINCRWGRNARCPIIERSPALADPPARHPPGWPARAGLGRRDPGRIRESCAPNPARFQQPL